MPRRYVGVYIGGMPGIDNYISGLIIEIDFTAPAGKGGADVSVPWLGRVVSIVPRGANINEQRIAEGMEAIANHVFGGGALTQLLDDKDPNA